MIIKKNNRTLLKDYKQDTSRKVQKIIRVTGLYSERSNKCNTCVSTHLNTRDVCAFVKARTHSNNKAMLSKRAIIDNNRKQIYLEACNI